MTPCGPKQQCAGSRANWPHQTKVAFALDTYLIVAFGAMGDADCRAAGMNRRLTSAIGQAAILGLAMTVMIQRLGLPDLASMTEWTSPVTSDPSIVKVVFCRRC